MFRGWCKQLHQPFLFSFSDNFAENAFAERNSTIERRAFRESICIKAGKLSKNLYFYEMNWVIIGHTGLAWYMVGLIWFVQVVHYPLMGHVPKEAFVAYEHRHTHLTSFVTAPIMILELGSAIWLAWQMDQLPWFWWGNLAAVLMLWASTFFIQVPLHNKLSANFDAQAVRRLVRTNWIRTVLWTGKALVLAWYIIAS